MADSKAREKTSADTETRKYREFPRTRIIPVLTDRQFETEAVKQPTTERRHQQTVTLKMQLKLKIVASYVALLLAASFRCFAFS